jgi:uncharacterized membrane protein (UPF0127 family)
MERVAVHNVSRAGAELGTRIGVANTFWTRLRGLLRHPPLDTGEGLLLKPCQAVHMYGMKQALDVAFLGSDGSVLAVYHELRPGQRSRYHRRARQALELPVGTLRSTDTRVGDRLSVRPVSHDGKASDGEYDDR